MMTVLLSGLFLGGTAFVDRQERRAADHQIGEIGGSLVSDVSTINDTSQPDVVTTLDLEYPRRIAQTYSYDIIFTASNEIIVSVPELERERTFVVGDDIRLEETDEPAGPDVQLTACGGGDNGITLGECS